MPDKFICPIPWISLSLGAKNAPRLCCHQSSYDLEDFNLSDALKLRHTQKVRNEMMNGKTPSECRSCFDLEKSGCRSPRLDYIDRFTHNPNSETQIKYLDITVDNDCNLECLMCSPLYSKKLSAFYETQLKATKTDAWTSELSIKNIEDMLPTLEQVTLTGGEPFLSAKSLKIMQTLVDSPRAQEIVLRVFTNLTHLPLSTLRGLSKLKRLELILSIDSVGENYELIRYPAKWEKILLNLKALKEAKLPNLDLHVHSVLTAVNWTSTGELIDFFKHNVPSYNILPIFAEIDTPQILHPRVLPEKQFLEGKESILSALTSLNPQNEWHKHQIDDLIKLLRKIEEAPHSDKYLDYQIFMQKLKNHRSSRLKHV